MFRVLDESHLHPRPYGVKDAETYPLHQLVDYYAAALCLGLRPKSHAHIHDILEKLTIAPPKLADLKYIHKRSPTDDPVMIRCITSYIRHREDSMSNHLNPVKVMEAIEHYRWTWNDEYLQEIFNGIEQSDLRRQTKVSKSPRPMSKRARRARRTIGASAVDIEDHQAAPDGGDLSSDDQARRSVRSKGDFGRDANGHAVSLAINALSLANYIKPHHKR